jgi:hypothetical protein
MGNGASTASLSRSTPSPPHGSRPDILAESDLRILVSGGSYCLARYDRTLIAIWRGVTTVAAIDTITAACQTLLAAVGGGATYITVLERSSPAPGEAERAVLARWSREVVPAFASAVAVAEGGGFRAALIRCVVLALTALVPHRIPFRFTGSVSEGAELLAPFLRPGRSVTQLLRAIELARARCDG